MSLFRDFLRALAQMGDRRFLGVMGKGVALTFGLLAGLYAGLVWLLQTATPETLELPWVGTIDGVHSLVGWGSLGLMLGLSVFLMVPVAALFTGLFIDQVVEAVETRHYPGLPPTPRLRMADTLIDAVNFFGLLIIANAVALFLYPFAGPFIPLVFWAVNGLLLGREYFTLVAMRRLGREGAKALRARHAGLIWLAGGLMAAPLSVPFVSLLIPVLGAATFTHLFHRLEGRSPAPPPKYPRDTGYL